MDSTFARRMATCVGVGVVFTTLSFAAPSAAQVGVNNAPVNTVPADQSTNEDTNRVFSTANGNAIFDLRSRRRRQFHRRATRRCRSR